MPKITRKLSELENNIKRQNALKMLSLDVRQQNDVLVESRMDFPNRPLAAWMCTENSPYKNYKGTWDKMAEFGEYKLGEYERGE